MNLKKLFHTYKQKMIWESVLKSFFIALMLGAMGVFITSLIYHIKIKETPFTLAMLIGTGVFSFSFLLLFVIRYPTQKKVAVRMDELGLQERVSTMLAYRNEQTEIAKLQRRDATEQIQRISAKQMPIRLFKIEWITCLVCVCLALTMMILPYNVLAFGEADNVSNMEQQQIIKDLIAELREKVKEAELDDDMKESLNEIIDNLEEDLQNTDSELEQAAKIEQAKEKMEELLEKALTRKQIGEALQKYELTRVLGEAVSAGNTERVTAAMDELEESLSADTTLVMTLSETITSALIDSGVEETDALYTAFSDFSSALSGLDVESEAFLEELTAVFDTAETAILAALEKQAAIEAAKDNMEEALKDAKDEVLGNEKKENEEGEKPEGEMPEGERPEGEMPEGGMPEGEMPEGGMPEGEMPEGMGGDGFGEDEGSTMTEGIYDPVSGSVSYGEVFVAYYAEYLAALEAGEVPEDLQEIMDQYFSSLS